MKPKTIPKKTNAIKDSLFLKSFKLAKSSPNKTGLMILFDGLFFILFFYILPILNRYISQNLIIAPIKFTSNSAFIIFVLITTLLKLVYYLIVLFIYSFFKYSILDFVKSLFENTEFSFKRLGQFYSLNIIIAGIFFAVMMLLNFILASIQQSYAPFVFIILAVPYVLFLYVIINTSHSLFYEGDSIKNTIKKGFRMAFTKIKSYRETILIIVLFALALWLLFFGSGYSIQFIASKNYNLYLNTYAYFKQVSIIVFDIVVYLVILINRISFYSVVKEDR